MIGRLIVMLLGAPYVVAGAWCIGSPAAPLPFAAAAVVGCVLCLMGGWAMCWAVGW